MRYVLGPPVCIGATDGCDWCLFRGGEFVVVHCCCSHGDLYLVGVLVL